MEIEPKSVPEVSQRKNARKCLYVWRGKAYLLIAIYNVEYAYLFDVFIENPKG